MNHRLLRLARRSGSLATGEATLARSGERSAPATPTSLVRRASRASRPLSSNVRKAHSMPASAPRPNSARLAASQTPRSCKQRSSSAAAGVGAGGIGQTQPRVRVSDDACEHEGRALGTHATDPVFATGRARWPNRRWRNVRRRRIGKSGLERYSWRGRAASANTHATSRRASVSVRAAVASGESSSRQAIELESQRTAS